MQLETVRSTHHLDHRHHRHHRHQQKRVNKKTLLQRLIPSSKKDSCVSFLSSKSLLIIKHLLLARRLHLHPPPRLDLDLDAMLLHLLNSVALHSLIQTLLLLPFSLLLFSQWHKERLLLSRSIPQSCRWEKEEIQRRSKQQRRSNTRASSIVLETN